MHAGEPKKSNKKSRRETDDAMHRPKKVKAGDIKFAAEGWTYNNGPSASREDTKGNDNPLSRDDYDPTNAQVSSRKGKQKIQASRIDKSPDMGNHGIKELPGKKRKLKDCQESQSHEMPLPGSRQHFQDRAASLEEFSENSGYRKEKKPKLSKSGGRVSSGSKGNGKISQSNNQLLGRDVKGTSQGLSPMKRIPGCVQPSAAATSSSSKISGSHKSRNSFQELKGSPVESVSSSPMRILNPEKLLSTTKTLGKEDPQGNGYYVTGSPRKCSDVEEDGGSHRPGMGRAEKSFSKVHRSSVDSSAVDFHDSKLGRVSNVEGKFQSLRSPDITNQHSKNGILDNVEHGIHNSVKKQPSDSYDDEEKRLDNHFHANGSARKSSKSRSKENIRGIKPEVDGNENEVSEFRGELQDCEPSNKVKPEDCRSKLKSGSRSRKMEDEYVGKKESSGKLSHENSKGGLQSTSGVHDGPDVKEDAICNQNRVLIPSKTIMQNREVEKSSKRSSAEKNEQEQSSGREKSLPLPPSGVGQNETLAHCPQSAVGNQKETGLNNLPVCGLEADDAPKVTKVVGKAGNHIETQQISSRHRTPNGHKVRDLDAPSPLRKESSSQAATNALKEATDLKHLADRLKVKLCSNICACWCLLGCIHVFPLLSTDQSRVFLQNSGSTTESIGYYFQAALKFLHGASLLELSNSQNGRHGDMIQSIKMYSSTAKLCE